MPVRSRRGSTLGPRIRRGVGIAAALPVLAAVPAAHAQTLTGSGSSAAQPYMLKLFNAYSKTKHNKIRFKYFPNGGNAGVQDVQAGRSQFAIQTRPPLRSDSGTVYVKLFLDGLCIAVNPANHLSNASIGQVKDIFLGTDTNWNQLPGSGLSTTIAPVGRNSSAGLYTFFQQAVLGGKTQASNVLQQTSDGLVATAVHRDPNAIGYVGLAHSGAANGVKNLTINGIACNQANIKTENYPLFRYVWGVFPIKRPNVQVEKFFDWVRTSKQAGGIINRAGAVPAFNKH